MRGDYPYYFSSHASPSYRYRRLTEVLDKPGKRLVDDHWALQRDDTNVMAREIAPVMAEAFFATRRPRNWGRSYRSGISESGPIWRRR